ncbi:MAG: isoprenyl transferase, partial [Rhodobacteraceae bacterium]|nr:isoprenyl transferase [Paracoccaceae bacterium]
EYRTSNFLPWQCAYSEYIFTETAWPDFTIKEVVKTLNDFKGRDRRFGASATR